MGLSTCGPALALIVAVLLSISQPARGCDELIREKYCHMSKSPSCLKCELGPRCPINGPRSIPETEGTLLVRGLKEKSNQEFLLDILDQKRISQSFSSCVPLFQWDPDLAQVAQAWADQCALVEYHDDIGGQKRPKQLHHDHRDQRLVSVEDRFTNDPGIAQSVHWVRSNTFDLSQRTMIELANSEIQTEDGLIDGLFTTTLQNGGGHMITFGQATHVGCGWIQFPSNQSGEYENFLVCNYGLGVAQKTTCSNGTTFMGPNANHTSYITYYTAPSQVIEDVKACLNAVKCRRRQLDFMTQSQKCGDQVEHCLTAKSGLKFIKPAKLRKMARSGNSPIEIEASKCKIDTILCTLNASFACEERIRRCLPLLDLLNPDSESNPNLVECQCSNLVLADGTQGDCSQVDVPSQKRFCYVQQSPCVTLGGSQVIEVSQPDSKLNGLVHKIMRWNGLPVWYSAISMVCALQVSGNIIGTGSALKQDEVGGNDAIHKPLLVNHVLRVKKSSEATHYRPKRSVLGSEGDLDPRDLDHWAAIFPRRGNRNDALRHALRIKRPNNIFGQHALRVRKASSRVLGHALRVRRDGPEHEDLFEEFEDESAPLFPMGQESFMEPYIKRALSRSHILRAI
eukprot:maker-scaffold1703_size30640-snap-gene-0.8 protein:Tk04672 transcript:maker-scaffold1703_size30640-snap-gene-0.8-mRNA-1 annotation:"venom allergen 3-like"